MSVRGGLTPKRPRDMDDYSAMLRRMIRAAGRRVAEGDPEDLAELVAIREALDAAIGDGVRGVRTHYSWGDIAAALGVTRQSAHERFRGYDVTPVTPVTTVTPLTSARG